MWKIPVFVIFILFVKRFVDSSGVRFLPEPYYFLTTQSFKQCVLRSFDKCLDIQIWEFKLNIYIINIQTVLK